MEKDKYNSKEIAELKNIDNESTLVKSLSKEPILKEIEQTVEYRLRLKPEDHFEYAKDMVFMNARGFHLLMSLALACLCIPAYFLWSYLVVIPAVGVITYTVKSQMKLYVLKQEILNPYLEKKQ